MKTVRKRTLRIYSTENLKRKKIKSTNKDLSPQIFSFLNTSFREKGAMKVENFLYIAGRTLNKTKKEYINSLKKVV
jgi:hypothetical protein